MATAMAMAMAVAMAMAMAMAYGIWHMGFRMPLASRRVSGVSGPSGGMGGQLHIAQFFLYLE
jgi:hypothetical protein